MDNSTKTTLSDRIEAAGYSGLRILGRLINIGPVQSHPVDEAREFDGRKYVEKAHDERKGLVADALGGGLEITFVHNVGALPTFKVGECVDLPVSRVVMKQGITQLTVDFRKLTGRI